MSDQKPMGAERLAGARDSIDRGYRVSLAEQQLLLADRDHHAAQVEHVRVTLGALEDEDCAAVVARIADWFEIEGENAEVQRLRAEVGAEKGGRIAAEEALEVALAERDAARKDYCHRRAKDDGVTCEYVAQCLGWDLGSTF